VVAIILIQLSFYGTRSAKKTKILPAHLVATETSAETATPPIA
jgi:hypothetical protein